MLRGVINENEFVWPPHTQEPSAMAINWLTTLLLDSVKLIARNLKRPIVPFTKVEDAQHQIQQRMIDASDQSL